MVSSDLFIADVTVYSHVVMALTFNLVAALTGAAELGRQMFQYSY